VPIAISLKGNLNADISSQAAHHHGVLTKVKPLLSRTRNSAFSAFRTDRITGWQIRSPPSRKSGAPFIMAKSSRASSRKVNNQRLKQKVFGPVEAARMQRLSSKLIELASQPKQQQEGKAVAMEGVESQGLSNFVTQYNRISNTAQ
jgi:hypothetical protein